MCVSTLQHTSIHGLGPHASFGCTPMPWSAFFCETLIHGPQIIYPLDVLLRGVAWCSFRFFCVCLGHIYYVCSCWSQVVAICYPVSLELGVSQLYKSRNFVFTLERMHARGDECTRGQFYVCFKMTTHIYTCARPTCKFWLYSDALERVFLRNPDLWALDYLPPRCSSKRGTSVLLSLFCVF